MDIFRAVGVGNFGCCGWSGERRVGEKKRKFEDEGWKEEIFEGISFAQLERRRGGGDQALVVVYL